MRTTIGMFGSILTGSIEWLGSILTGSFEWIFGNGSELLLLGTVCICGWGWTCYTNDMKLASAELLNAIKETISSPFLTVWASFSDAARAVWALFATKKLFEFAMLALLVTQFPHLMDITTKPMLKSSNLKPDIIVPDQP